MTIKFAYTNTGTSGGFNDAVEYGVYQPERRYDVKNPYLNSMQQAMNTDIQQRFLMDWVGLVRRPDNLWGRFSKDNYDVVYFHLAPQANDIKDKLYPEQNSPDGENPSGKLYRWYEIITRSRNLLGDKCPFLIVSIDNESQHDNPNSEYFKNIMKELQSADLVIHVTDKAKNIWSRHVSTPIRYLTAPKVYEQWAERWNLKTIPFKHKLNRVAVMYNTFPSAQLDSQLKAVKISGYKGLVFTGWFWVSGLYRTMTLIRDVFGEFEFPFARELYKKLATFKGDMKDFFNYKIPYVFELYDWLDICKRLERKEYYKLLRWCKVGIQDNYIGASRFVAECAIFKIPVITGDTVTAGRHVFPELQTKSRDVGKQAVLIEKLMISDVYNKYVGDKGFWDYQEHYGLDAYCNNLYRILLSLGVKDKHKLKIITTRDDNKINGWYEGFGETPEGKKDDLSFHGMDMAERETR